MNPTKEMERNGLHPEQMPTKKKSSKSRHLNPTKKMEKPDHIRKRCARVQQQKNEERAYWVLPHLYKEMEEFRSHL